MEIICHDCGAVEGALHTKGCDRERCPFCGGQLVTCGCCYKMLGFDYDRDALFSGLPMEVYRHGLNAELRERWEAILEDKGRIPFIVYPSMCARCGEKWPKMHMLPDWEWNRYVEPAMRNRVLCEKCFREIESLIEKHASPPMPDMVACPDCSTEASSGRMIAGACPTCRGQKLISVEQLAEHRAIREEWKQFDEKYQKEQRIIAGRDRLMKNKDDIEYIGMMDSDAE